MANFSQKCHKKLEENGEKWGIYFMGNRENRLGNSPFFPIGSPPMGSFDGAETCEMVVIYLLNKLSKILPIHQTGLYRDDGFIVIENVIENA